MTEEKRARSTVSSGETLMIIEFPSPCESFHANSLINQELLPVDVLDFVSSQNVFHQETHSRCAGSCCGAGTAGSCPTSRRAGPAGRRPCRLCTATETSRRVRPSAPATTRKPEEDESGRKVKELHRKLCYYYYYKLYFHRQRRDLVFASTFKTFPESCM